MTGTVCLTFDFDAVSIWLQRNMKSPTSVSRGEYGVLVVPRILHMLKKRNIKSTWFVTGHTLETYPEACALIVAEGHEIGLHGYMHENFSQLSDDEEKAILEKTYQLVVDLTGQPPKGFRSPSWDISNRTIENLEAMELLYDSSQMAHDYSPYYSRKNDVFLEDGPTQFGEVTKLVEIPVSWSLDDYPHFEFLRTPTSFIPGLQNANLVYENWLMDVEYMLRDFENGIVVATFHPQVSGRGHRILALEKWIDTLLEKKVNFSRMDEIAEAFSQGKEFGKFIAN